MGNFDPAANAKWDDVGRGRRVKIVRFVASAVGMGILFLLAQSPTSGSGGGACVRWLTGPDPEAQPVFEWQARGLPWEFLRVTGGCGSPGTRQFTPIALIADILVFAALGASVYGILTAVDMMRRHPRGESDAASRR
jgi:hypothetical protein